jgi:hypothetical protein
MQSGKFWSAMARRGEKQTAMHFIFGALHFCHQPQFRLILAREHGLNLQRQSYWTQ